MFVVPMFAALLSAPPAVVAGPELGEQATVVDAPIDQVTVFSDRARVRRRAKLSLSAGAHALRLPDLQGSVLLDTIRVSVRPGKLLRVESAPVQRERISLDQVDGFIESLEKLSDEVAVLDGRVAAINAGLGIVVGAQPAAPVPEKDRQGRPGPGLLTDVWKRAMDFLFDTRGKARERLRALALERKEKVEKIELLQRQIQRLDLGGFSDQRIQVLAIVEVPGGGSQVELEYFSTGAFWKPAYDLRFDANQGAVVMDTAGAVTQATGEDWSEVELELSTAIPGQSITLPKLLTWTLGEAKEFIPQVRPKAGRPAPPYFPLPQPVPSRAELERALRTERLAARLAELQGLAQATPEDVVADKAARLSDEAPKEVPVRGGVGSASGKRSVDFSGSAVSGAMARPQAPSPAPQVMNIQEMDEPAYAPAPSSVDRESRGESLLSRVAGALSGDSGPSGVQTPLAMYERPAPTKLVFPDPDLPAMLAGGLDYVYQGQARVSVKSTAENVRVPLAKETYPVSAYYTATPGIDSTAFLEATVTNQGERPILRGPLTIFVSGNFAGDGFMETTGPGAQIRLPLGADEDVRLKRKVIPKTETKGVFSKDDVTTYRVIIEVANYKKRAIKVGVKEPLPKTNNEDLEIELLKVTPKQAAGPDDEGIMRWELELQPGKTRTIELEYKITRPANWQLYQQ